MLWSSKKSFPKPHVCALYLDQYFSKWFKNKQKKKPNKPQTGVSALLF